MQLVLELRYGVAALICHPDVGSVEGHLNRPVPDGEVAKVSAVARSQFGHGVTALVRHPDIGSVKCQSKWGASHIESAEVTAVVSAQFGRRNCFGVW